VESTQVDIDSAMRIETRWFISLVMGTVARNMINTFWFQLNEIKAGIGRPKEVARASFTKVGILGAGMMGAGIAHACATRGLAVVLKDVSVEAAEKGKGYSAKILGKQLAKGKLTQEKHDATLALIRPTESAADLAGCELVIEAVFEDRELKARVTREAEAELASTAIFASNTSTLPITGLAGASARAANFIGLHFFSPADRMPLVEIICGKDTSPETLARSYDFVQQIGKTPVIVNDARGFFTSRVFGTFCHEGIAMLREGVPAAAIENGALLAGFPVGPLAVSDEVSLTLMSKIRHQTIADLRAEGKEYVPHQAESVIDWMLEQNRAGKAAGKGFYEYPEGARKFLWPELATRYGRAQPPGAAGRHQGATAVRAGDRNGALPRRGRADHVARREHRLDLRHRLSGLDRRRAAVHQRLRPARLRGARARARASLRRPLPAAGFADRARRTQRRLLNRDPRRSAP
jgi:3-hydroxyacyl-CoA dehydrogenase/enoyl-CoA hydratase/3-hydroxybutyryl-CoA epimerase